MAHALHLETPTSQPDPAYETPRLTPVELPLLDVPAGAPATGQCAEGIRTQFAASLCEGYL